MKQGCVFALLCLSILVLLSGCQTNNQNFSEAYSFETDHQIDHDAIAEAKDGYYFLKETSRGSYLYCFDQQNIDPIPLCDKPNCLHDKETNPEKLYDCNAYMADASQVFYNDGYLYILARGQADGTSISGVYLRKLSPQGTFIENAYRFPTYPNSVALHRGNLFYSSNEYIPQDSGKSAGTCSLIQVALNEKKEKLLYSTDLESGNIATITAVGKRLFFIVSGYEDKSAGQVKTIQKNYCMDLESEAISSIDSKTGEAVMGTPAVLPDAIYYSYWYYDYDDERNRTVYQNNFDGTEEKAVFSSPSVCDRLCWDGSYFYFDNWPTIGIPGHESEVRTIWVYDKDFQPILSFNLSNINGKDYSIPSIGSFLNVSNDFLFFLIQDDAGEKNQTTLIYVNKDEIKNGTVQLNQVILDESS